ncbi:MAG: hypothetical protein NVS3B19_03030 [Ginsengibacter sp.]
MKIENTLVHYLLLKRVLILQGLGTFYINDNVHIPSDVHTDVVLPPDSVRFEYDPKIGEDDDLINYIVKETKKIKPLVSADLDSYIMLGKQFLNIGKPFIIPGLGTLDKTQAVELQFIPGQYITPKITAPKALKANEDEVSSGLFQDHERKLPPNYDRRILGLIAAIIILLGLGWAIYYFAFRTETTPVSSAATENDSSLVKNDQTAKAVDTTHLAAKPDSILVQVFDVIIYRELRKRVAIKKLDILTKLGHAAFLTTDDSVRFSIKEHYKNPIADSTRVLDSLRKYYGNKIALYYK